MKVKLSLSIIELIKDDDKITIQFKAAGSAPILKNNKIFIKLISLRKSGENIQ